MTFNPMSAPATRLCTEAWLLHGVSSIPDELSFLAGQLSFTAHNTGSAWPWPWQMRKLEREFSSPGMADAIDAGKPALVFRWSAQDIHAGCPWYYFGAGMRSRGKLWQVALQLTSVANQGDA